MSDVAIDVNNLSKSYRIGDGVAYRTLRESVMSMFSKKGAETKQDDTLIEALHDISFQVKHGEVLGVVGSNGAGKSTLLKILSRITEPTSGYADIHGRVGALLEVGTGFHPELTGRENVFLNGAVLGMSRVEINAKFDEIVAFSGVEKFIDTPVKRYSSGMQVRLAFAVAAHLEPDVLIIDEVLAVGDMEFQKRCMGKMDDVAGQGRTILFVSHNMSAIERLCTRALLLENGRLVMNGSTSEIIGGYLSSVDQTPLSWAVDSPPDGKGYLSTIRLVSPDGAPIEQVLTNGQVAVEFECVIREPLSDCMVAVAVHDDMDRAIFSTSPVDSGAACPVTAGRHRYRVLIPESILFPQRYSITISLYSTTLGQLHSLPHVMRFDVLDTGSSRIAFTQRIGVLQVQCDWSHEHDDEVPGGDHV